MKRQGERGKDKKKRKPGTGLRPPKYIPLKGMYKIYGLQDPMTMDIMFIEMTKLYACKAFASIIYWARNQEHQSPKDKWIRSILDEGKRPIQVMLKYLDTKDKREANEEKNKWIRKYGILNQYEAKFRDWKYRRDWTDRYIIIDYSLSGYTITQISERLNISKDVVKYWRYKLGVYVNNVFNVELTKKVNKKNKKNNGKESKGKT